MSRVLSVLIVLAAIGGGTGRAAFQPQIRCASKAIPVYWADGTETSMKMSVCGYNWKLRK